MLRELHFDPRRATRASPRMGWRRPGSTLVLATPEPVAWPDHVAASARTTSRAPGARAGQAAGGGSRGGVAMRGAGAAGRDR
jgi:hypothetical protein